MGKGLSLQQKQILHLLAYNDDGRISESQAGKYIIDSLYGLPPMPEKPRGDLGRKYNQPVGTYYDSWQSRLRFIKTPTQRASLARALKRLTDRGLIERATTTEQGYNPFTGKRHTYQAQWIRLTELGKTEVAHTADIPKPWLDDNG